MNVEEIAAEAAARIMFKQEHRGLIRDVAYTIIKAAIEKALQEKQEQYDALLLAHLEGIKKSYEAN